MAYETIDWQQNGHVVVATLNRPESLNAINQKMDHELICLIDYAMTIQSELWFSLVLAGLSVQVMT